jgi:hypothetical protein
MQEMTRAMVDGSLDAIFRKERAEAEAANPKNRAERRRAEKAARREQKSRYPYALPLR